MDKPSMCRVCLGEDMQLHSIVDTHLQEMYESLAMTPLITIDGRPLLVCYICRARLENCFELRWSCLRSENLLTQMLSSNKPEQVKLQRINNKRLTMHNVVHLAMGQELEMNADNVGVEGLKCEVKHEAINGEDIDENALEENSDFDNVQSVDSDDDSLMTMMDEQTGNRRGDPTLKETTQHNLTNPENLTSSNLKDHELVQDISQVVYTFTAADVTAVTSTNEETFTLADDTKKRPTSVPRSERVQYTCDTCQQCYSSKCELERHIRLCSDAWKTDLSRENSTSTYTHTAEKPFECNICKKKETSEGYLRIHMLQHTGGEPYQCNICKRQFSKEGYLRQHMSTHSGKKTFECSVCKKQFSSERYVAIHMRTHTGQKPFECTVCKKQYSSESYLPIHMRTHTVEKPFECTVCKKQYSSESYLTIHMRTHTGEKLVDCTVCNKSFVNMNTLIRHMRTHTGEKPYQCDICERKFARKHCIKDHMHIHSGVKPYQCNECKKRFSRKSSLRSHMRTHTGEKPYQCNVCKKMLSRIDHLKRHMRTHTGEKPNHCGICKKQFSRKYNLISHMRTHRC